MGAEPYEYFVDYKSDIQEALDRLRADVFAKGEYHGAELNPATPEEALALTDADGTASILDIEHVADAPDFFCAAPFSSEELQDFFGTMKPTKADVLQGDEYWDEVDRGHARYVVVYDDEQPTELYFAGYSFD